MSRTTVDGWERPNVTIAAALDTPAQTVDATRSEEQMIAVGVSKSEQDEK